MRFSRQKSHHTGTQRNRSLAAATRPTDGNGKCVETSYEPVRRKLAHKAKPNAGCFLGIVFEAVMPFWMFERNREYCVAREHQSFAT